MLNLGLKITVLVPIRCVCTHEKYWEKDPAMRLEMLK